jgi:hypothetical protein
MVNRKGIRCGAQGCRYFSGLWRAKEKLASGFEKDGAPENRGAVFCGALSMFDNLEVKVLCAGINRHL